MNLGSSQDGAAEEPPASVGAALERCYSALLRWGSRADTQRRMRSGRTDLSPTDAWLLRRIIEVGPVRLGELAAWQAVDKSTMTAQVSRLERKGLVSRKGDTEDRRAVNILATPKGQRLHARNVAEAQRVLDHLVADWPTEEKRQLARLLSKLVGGIEHN